MDTGLLILELAKLTIQTYFSYMKIAGKTDEEIEEIYSEEKAKFTANKPEDLPEV